jgi:hypothetical protein
MTGSGDASAPELAVVPDAQHAEAERLHRLFGAVDLRQRRPGHLGPVREARRQARGRRLLRARDGELAGEHPHLVLADAGLEQRVTDAMLGCRAQSRTPVTDVVGVCPRQHRRVAIAPR